MYTAAEASLVKQKFWTSFGMYMSPVPSATLEKVNWVNYKTGIKGISFKMDADKNAACVIIEIFLKDTMLQHQFFEIFNRFAVEFENTAGKKWSFQKDSFLQNNRNVSAIKIELKDVNVFKESDWPAIISFLKLHLVGLDKFWALYKPAFELV